MSLPAIVRRLSMVAIALALPAGGCVAKAVVEGRAELRESLRLREEDVGQAIVHARRAASWYVPLASHTDDAHRELTELATAAERRGDRENALFAWRSIRAASLSTRWLVEPYRQKRLLADAAIARLSSEEPPPSPLASQKLGPRELERLHASWLARDDAPRPLWVLVMLLGLAGWAGGAYSFVTRGMTERGRLVPEVAKRAAMVAAAGVGMFVLGLWLA